jgi:hypothetical protein
MKILTQFFLALLLLHKDEGKTISVAGNGGP